MTKTPDFKQWIRMTEEERLKICSTWNVYAGEGQEIALKVLKKFKEKYANIPRLKIGPTVGVYHGGIWAMYIEHPFIFDRRKIPQQFLGIAILGGALLKDLPEEFNVKNPEKEYIWAPDRYEKFVDRHIDEIRKELNDPDMSKEEILDALIGGDFNAHIQQCKRWKEEGATP